MGVRLGLHVKSHTCRHWVFILACTGFFNLVNRKSTEHYECVGSQAEINPLPRSSAEAWAAGGGFGQFTERGK